MKTKHLLISVILATLFLASTSTIHAQIREIPVPTLQDIAIASYDQYGPVIYYNPQIVQQSGPLLTEYFKAHEYAHHILNHIQREFFEANPYNRAWVRVKYELEADCYASKHISPQARQAAYDYHYKQGANRGSELHPTGFERADRIFKCSQ